MGKVLDSTVINGVTYQQSDFFDILEGKKLPIPSVTPKAEAKKIPLAPTPSLQKTPSVNPRVQLPPNQQMGFREDYNEAMITLYVIGVLSSCYDGKIEEIDRLSEQAQKTKIRYERYMPKASQNIIHYGRDVVDAYMYSNEFLTDLRCRAEKAKHPHALRHMYRYAQKTVDKVSAIIKDHNMMESIL